MVAKLFTNALLVSVALLGATPVIAQVASPTTTIPVRVDKLEKEMRAVQRKVFPGGAGMTVEAQVTPTAPTAAGVPASSLISDMTTRVDALERQLATLTGQVEQQGFRLKKIEDAMAAQKLAADAAAAALAPVTAAPSSVAATAKPAAQAAGVAGASAAATTAAMASKRPPSGDPAEDGYLTGYDLWEAKDYAGAQKLLSDVVKKYPKHKRYSYAQNLLGRAYLDEGKPVTAAKVFLENYRTNPQGERAADSLYFLGVTLIELKKLPDACKSFDELQAVYGANLRDYLKQRLPVARKEARCGV
ncbi:tetratricopeptide repeat protein [Aquisediminimonas sediminicola]|uniref:tetratricopeptide repeat protein n=1 Tax=Alteraquisediminimonas sediminicola TaxID=2676787 RepID=UPI001C8D6D74|nr:tetratricopeptide repeat protein [Aquisediminimonas sediminicola]